MNEDPTSPKTTDPVDDDTDEEHRPIGTFFLMMLFLVLICVMWLWMYGLLFVDG